MALIAIGVSCRFFVVCVSFVAGFYYVHSLPPSGIDLFAYSLPFASSISLCLPHLKLLTSGPHVQLMRPQARLLLMQPQIRLTNSISAHLLTHLLIFSVFICNCTITNRVYDMHALLAHLASQCLRQLTDRGAPSTICSELSTASKRAERASKDKCLLFKISSACNKIDVRVLLTPFFSDPSIKPFSP